jgi:glutamine amidotransferase
MQLLMSESEEFGRHDGLGLIPGRVRAFEGPVGSFGAGATRFTRRLKVPHVGWNRVEPVGDRRRWSGTPLAALAPGSLMYFVHSYYVVPDEEATALTRTEYGGIEFCSSLRQDNVFACQFHPERSGPDGLSLYRAIGETIRRHPCSSSI